MSQWIKSKCSGKEYPANTGTRWTTKEENELIKELDENINIETIAKKHNRTIRGIECRQQSIAYDMHMNNISI